MDSPSVGIPVLDYFLGLLADHGYAVTFVFAFVENIFILGSVIPGETVQVAAGFVSSSGALNPFALWLVAFMGSFAGGNLSYFVGRRGGRALVKAIMRRFRVPEARLLSAEAYFDKHGNATVFLARWVAGFKNLAPAIAGISKMPLGLFELYSFLGALVYTSVLIAGGYFFGQYLDVVVGVVKGSAWGFLGLVVVVVSYTRYRLWRHRKLKELEEEALTGRFEAVIGGGGSDGRPE
ncbi:MAG: DedA family protein [Coriobacteriia bacterium]